MNGTTEKMWVGVLCKVKSVAGQATCGTVTCARDSECVGDSAHKEHCNVSLSHARENICACECVRGAMYYLHNLFLVVRNFVVHCAYFVRSVITLCSYLVRAVHFVHSVCVVLCSLFAVCS